MCIRDRCIAEITGTEFEVMFISEDDDKLDEIQNMAIEASQKKKTKSAAEKAGLNRKYTFCLLYTSRCV